MAKTKKTKKTKTDPPVKTEANPNTASQPETTPSDATATLLTKDTVEPETAPQNETGGELQKQETETLEPEPENEAVLHKKQCPRCKHINSERGFIFPGLNRVVAPGVYEGVKYQIVETRRTKCEKCGQIFFIKKYL
jgi:phage FluMu protein Com